MIFPLLGVISGTFDRIRLARGSDEAKQWRWEVGDSCSYPEAMRVGAIHLFAFPSLFPVGTEVAHVLQSSEQ